MFSSSRNLTGPVVRIGLSAASVLIVFLFVATPRLWLAEVAETQRKEMSETTLDRDPMMPANSSIFEPVKRQDAVKRSPFKVQGVGRGPRGIYVIIGGNVLREGETKDELTVVKIGKTKVDILLNGTPDSLPIE